MLGWLAGWLVGVLMVGYLPVVWLVDGLAVGRLVGRFVGWLVGRLVRSCLIVGCVGAICQEGGRLLGECPHVLIWCPHCSTPDGPALQYTVRAGLGPALQVLICCIAHAHIDVCGGVSRRQLSAGLSVGRSGSWSVRRSVGRLVGRLVGCGGVLIVISTCIEICIYCYAFRERPRDM